MRRVAVALLAIGVLAFVAAGVWGWRGGPALMPSYLAAWLVLGGVPLGALLVVLCLDAGGAPVMQGWVAPLRLLALGLPVAALLVIPVLLRMQVLYPWDGGAHPSAPFGQTWLQPGFFVARTIAILVILSLLGLIAGLAPLPRAGAILALFVALLAGTLGSVDWAMSLDPHLATAEFGLLLMSMMAAAATCVAILAGWFAGLPARPAALLLAAVSAVWAYLHFMQYLTIWSGNLPDEVHWYQVSAGAAGAGVEWFGFVCGLLLPLLLAAAPARLQALALPAVALLALVAHLGEALWFVAPRVRPHFAITLPDALMLLGFAGLVLAAAMSQAAPRRRLA